MSKSQQKIIIGIDLAAIPKNPPRAIEIRKQIIKQGVEVIEVHPTSTRKALKMSEKDWNETQGIFIQMNLDGALKTHQLTSHKIDAVTAALTAHLHLQGKTEQIGNPDSYIVVPIKTDWRRLKL